AVCPRGSKGRVRGGSPRSPPPSRISRAQRGRGGDRGEPPSASFLSDNPSRDTGWSDYLAGKNSTQGRGPMKAIVVTDQAAGTAGGKLGGRPGAQGGVNEGVVQIHASGFTGDELTWPSTWTDRVGRDRTPSIPGHELAGVVTALGYGTTGLSIGQRVFGLTDWYRDGTLAEYVAVEARNLTPLPG